MCGGDGGLREELAQMAREMARMQAHLARLNHTTTPASLAPPSRAPADEHNRETPRLKPLNHMTHEAAIT